MEASELRRWREEHGDISQADLGRLLKVDQMTVSRWERAKHPIPHVVSLALEALESRQATPA